MAKPAITFRNTKGTPLNYDELDANFTNLRDATITVAADGNNIVLDLNDTLTLTPGTNVSFGVSGNTITVNASGSGDLQVVVNPIAEQSNLTYNSITNTLTFTPVATDDLLDSIVQDTTPQLGGDLDVNGNNITNSQGDVITIQEDVILGNSGVIKISDLVGSNRIECTADLIIGCVSSFGASFNGPKIIFDQSSLAGGSISIGTGVDKLNDRIFISDVVRLASLSGTQVTNLVTPLNGMILYNSTTNKFQGYANGSWVNLH